MHRAASNESTLESFSWVTKRYKPQRWWFEIVTIYYKVVVCSACQTLDRAESAVKLLVILVIAAVLFMLGDGPSHRQGLRCEMNPQDL